MPFGRAGIKAATEAAAGITPSETRYLGLLIDNNQPNARTDEASAAGYSRQAVTYTAGSSPQYRAAQGDDVTFNFTATSPNIRGSFISKNSSSESSDTNFQEGIVGWVTGANLENVGNGSVVTASGGEVRVT